MIAPGLETLSQYIKLGIKLAAVNDYGAYVERDAANRFTDDWETIKKMTKGEYIFHNTTLPNGTPIKLFRFMPNEAGLLCIDVDCKNGLNGMDNLNKIIAEYNPALKENFNNTTFVKTPNNGYHFYFKFQNNYAGNLKPQICPGVEVKYKNALTAAGSVKDGKTYKLNGMLENALPLPEQVLKMAERETIKPKEKRFDFLNNLLEKMAGKMALEVVSSISGVWRVCRGFCVGF